MLGSSFPFMFGSRFVETFDCYSVAKLDKEREDVERGGKIILPQTVLECLSQQNSTTPMLFKITNPVKSLYTHVGVLEFTAEEGNCYVPDWLYRFLELAEGDEVIVETVTLPVATFAKFQPIGEEFLDITNPKAVLENELRCFACLTAGDIITIHYNKRTYELRVLETQPDEAVSIIVCDMHVEFEAPEGFNDPNANKKPPFNDESLTFIPSFAGQGIRLDGKPKKQSDNESKRSSQTPRSRGIPDFSYNFGELRFDRNIMPITAQAFPVLANATTPNSSGNFFPGTGFAVQEDAEEEID